MTKQDNTQRVLLITSVSEPGYYSSPSLGLYRIKHYLEQRNIACDVFDLEIDDTKPFLDATAKGHYDVIGFSVSHRNMHSDLDMLWKLKDAVKKSNKRVIFIGGGQEATLNYEQWLDAGIEIIVSGFAEKRFYELCKTFAEHPELSADYLCKDIDGMIFRKETGDTKFTPSATLTQEEFEEYSYHQMMSIDIPYEKYWSRIRTEVGNSNFNKNKFVVENVRVFTSSHCPRGCGFCSSQAFLPASQEKRSPIIMISAQQVHDVLMKFVNEYGARSFLFSDDDFLIGNKRGLERNMELMRLIIESKEKGDMPKDVLFNCQTRVACFIAKDKEGTHIRWDLLDLMKRAGFHSIGIGVETLSDRLLQAPSINKVGISAEDCCVVIEALLSKGLLPQINLILAIPESTPEELFHSMMIGTDYILKGCQVAVTARLEGIPGAPLVSEEGYECVTLPWTNPETGKTIHVLRDFLPQHPELRAIADQIEPVAAKELERLKQLSPWKKSTVPRFLTGLSFFIAVSNLLNRKDMAQHFEKIVFKVIDQVESLANV